MSKYSEEIKRVCLQMQDDTATIPMKIIRNSYGEIQDIELLINSLQRRALQQHLPAEAINITNASYTFILQNELARYYGKKMGKHHAENKAISKLLNMVRGCTQAFNILEAKINAHHTFRDPLQNCTTLLLSLRQYKQQLIDLIPKDDKDCNSVKDELIADTDRFISYLQLKASSATIDTVKSLFSIHSTTIGLTSIGEFIRRQYMILTGTVIPLLYKAHDYHPIQAFNMDPAIQAVSRARAAIELKGSGYGVRYQNARMPMPASMLLRQENVALKVEPTQVSIDTVKKSFSLRRLSSRVDDPEFIEKVFTILAGEETTQAFGIQEKAKRLGLGGLVFLAAIADLPIAITRFVAMTFCYIPAIFAPSYFAKVDVALSWLHKKVSPLIYAKKLKSQLVKKAELFTGENREIFAEMLHKHHNGYDIFLSRGLSIENVGRGLRNTIENFIATAKHIISESMTLLKNAMRNDVERRHLSAFSMLKRKNKQQTDAIRKRLTDDKIKKLCQAINKKLAAVADEKVSDAKELIEFSHRGKWPGFELWAPNQMSSIIDFIDEICITLSDTVVDPMFRTSPGMATLWCIVAVMSLGAGLVPGITSQLITKQGVHTLQTVSEMLCKSFMGKEYGHAPMNKFITAFLEWKLGFFGSEAMVEAAHGNTEFLEQLFKEPEKITLATIILVATGMSLSFIPELPVTIELNGVRVPNPLAQFANLLSEESRECMQGVPGLYSIEHAFLSLKTLILLHSLVEGNNHVAIAPHSAASIFDFNTLQKRLADIDLNQSFEQIQAKLDEIFKVHFKLLLSSTGMTALLFKIKQTILQDIATLKQQPFKTKIHTTESKTANELKSVSHKKDDAPNLKTALQEVYLMEKLGLTFDQTKQAYDYYNLLHKLITKHNAAIPQDKAYLRIDKQAILTPFFNKHCYHGSSNLYKMLSMILFPVTWSLRAIKIMLAGSHSPVIRHSVRRSFEKEAAILLQSLYLVKRLVRSALRALSNIARGCLFVAFIACFPASIPFYMTVEKPQEKVHRFLIQIALHRISFTTFSRYLLSPIIAVVALFKPTRGGYRQSFIECWRAWDPSQWMKKLYSRFSRTAGVTHDHVLLHNVKGVLEHLNGTECDQSKFICNDIHVAAGSRYRLRSRFQHKREELQKPQRSSSVPRPNRHRAPSRYILR